MIAMFSEKEAPTFESSYFLQTNMGFWISQQTLKHSIAHTAQVLHTKGFDVR